MLVRDINCGYGSPGVTLLLRYTRVNNQPVHDTHSADACVRFAVARSPFLSLSFSRYR